MTYREVKKAIRDRKPFSIGRIRGVWHKSFFSGIVRRYIIIDYSSSSQLADMNNKKIWLKHYSKSGDEILNILCEELLNMPLEEARKKYKELSERKF